MESNWRYNVADLGWMASSYDLIARVSGAPFGLWVARHEVYDGYWTLMDLAADPLWPTPAAVHPITSAHPHFPYGLHVLPD